MNEKASSEMHWKDDGASCEMLFKRIGIFKGMCMLISSNLYDKNVSFSINDRCF